MTSDLTPAFLCLKVGKCCGLLWCFIFNCHVKNFRHKKRPLIARKALICMVAIGGLEPPTPGL